MAFTEAFGGTTTREDDGLTEGVIYYDCNDVAENLPNEFVLFANLNGEPYNKNFYTKGNQSCDKKEDGFAHDGDMSLGGTFKNIETISNEGEGYSHYPSPNSGRDGFDLEDFREDIETNNVHQGSKNAEDKIKNDVLIIIHESLEVRG